MLSGFLRRPPKTWLGLKFQVAHCVDRWPPRDVHISNSWNHEYNKLHDEGDFARVIKVRGSKTAGVTWIIQVGPIFLQLEAESKVREMHEESEI